MTDLLSRLQKENSVAALPDRVARTAAETADTLMNEDGFPPRRTRHSLRRLRNQVLVALGLAFSLEVLARTIHTTTDYHPLVAESVSMGALVLLCGSALYLIFWIRDTRLLAWCMALASAFLILSQIINIAEDVVPPDAVMFRGPWHNQVESLVLLAGLILMIATLYLALFDAVAVRRALIEERADLVGEIWEREQAQRQLRESQGRLRLLSAHMEQLREEERANIAREIHDELGQTLTSLRIDVATLRKQAPELPEPANETMQRMDEQLNGTMQTIRRIITELRPGVLDDLGLFPAIEWQVRDFEKRAGLSCEVNIDVDDPPWPREKATALFRIVQESLTNVARHARASHVSVRLVSGDESLVLRVSDDGRGFDSAGVESRLSFGLMGMRERAAQFGGHVRVESSEGRGTTVVVSMPYDDRKLNTTEE